MEDVFPAAGSYPYYWMNGESDLSLADFLNKYRPSMVQNDGSKPWIWVKKSEPEREDTGVEEAMAEGRKILDDVTKEVERIKNDASIPIRSNKKTGARSKKELREEKQAEATEMLKEIATRHGCLGGKWLINAQTDKVDLIWSSLAKSLVDGPLSSTPAFCSKVSTSSADENSNQSHVICLYMPDIFNKTAVTEVMRILLRNHGFNPNGVKSDLWTRLGIDSKHASGLQPTIWKSSALMKDTEMKELRNAYFEDLESAKTTKSEETATASSEKATSTKPKLKKKKQNDDPFASDNDEPEKTLGKRQKEDGNEDDKPKKKKTAK